MRKTNSFNDLLENVDKLSLDEQETLTEVLHRRIIGRKRAELVKDIQDAQREFREGKVKSKSPDGIMREVY